MAEFVYPSSDFDRARNMLAVLGSFWTRTYTARDQLRSYANGTGLLLAQSHRNLLETVASLSRLTVPIFHVENWVPIVLRKSERNSALTNVARFDRNDNTFDDSTLIFDTASASAFYSFPKPAQLVAAAQIFNKLVTPTVAWAQNVDYVIDAERDAIVFVTDPFETDGFLRKPIYDDNDVVDEEIVLWAWQGEYDYQHIFKQFGYALGVKLGKSSKGYRDIVNAVMSGLVNGGASVADLDLAFAAICDVPVVLEAAETVEVLQRDTHGTLVITDKHVYRFPEDANLLVEAGDEVTAGQALCDAVTITEFCDGTVPDGVTALALGKGFLAACYYDDLVFENKEVPLEVDTEHESGYTYVSFGLGGFPADVTRFFEDIHERGVAVAQAAQNACVSSPISYSYFADLPDTGNPDVVYYVRATQQYYTWNAETEAYVETAPPVSAQKLGTLAHVLDKRNNPDSEPTASNLPTTINPLKFVIANVLRNNVFLVQIKRRQLGQNWLGLYNIRHLRALIPPHTAMLVLYEIDGLSDTITGPDNITESVTTFVGLEPQSDTVPYEYLRDIGARLSVVHLYCQ